MPFWAYTYKLRVLDRLLVLVMSYRYNDSARRLIVYAELLCLALMTLAVCIYYQYLPQICTLIYGHGTLHAHLYCQNNWWKTRFALLIVVKALIGGVDTINCLAFVYQVRKLQHMKVVGFVGAKCRADGVLQASPGPGLRA